MATEDQPTRAEAAEEAWLDSLGPRPKGDPTRPAGSWGSPITMEAPL